MDLGHFLAWQAGTNSRYSTGESRPIKAGHQETIPHLETTCEIHHIYEEENESSSAGLGRSQQLEIPLSLNSKRAACFSSSASFSVNAGFNARKDSIVRLIFSGREDSTFRLIFSGCKDFTSRGDFNACKDFSIRLIFTGRKDFSIRHDFWIRVIFHIRCIFSLRHVPVHISQRFYFNSLFAFTLKVLSNGAGGGPKLVSIDPF
jgi:hypothetical protein